MSIATLAYMFCIGIYCAKSQETISCDETKTGYISDGEEIEYIFVSDGYYDDIYLDGCDSDYDMVLKIKNSTNSIIQIADNSPECGPDTTAADITIPDALLPVTNGDIYTFVVSGYSAGNYIVSLFCTEFDDTAPVTTDLKLWTLDQSDYTDWTFGGDTKNDKQTSYCASTSSYCHGFRGGSSMYVTDAVSTIGYTDIKLGYFLVEHGQYQLEPEDYDRVKIYYSIDNSQNWVLFQEYSHDGSIIEERQTLQIKSGSQGPYTYSIDDVEEFQLPEACNNNIGVRIRFENTGNEPGAADVIYINYVSLRGTSGTPSPTGVTISPTTAAPTTTATPTTTAPTPVTATPITAAPTTIDTTTTVPISCGRHREPWHMISDADRLLFINGFKQLSRDGKLATFTTTHSTTPQHQNAAFLPWHRYFIWELETQFRELGDEYQCFGLPYWDWTSDIALYEYNIADYQILNSGLGGDGTGNDNYCVEGNFDESQYTASSGGCLRREVCDPTKEDCSGAASASQLMSFITSQHYYGNDDEDDGGYRNALENDPHYWAHVYVGGENGQLRNIKLASDDPIFYLLHTFLDYQYSLWQDCRNHELIDNDDITTTLYDGTLRATVLDASLNYGVLENVPWSYISGHDVKIRDMHSNADWDVSYDKGDFFDRAQVENNNICSGNINPIWFKDITSRRRLVNKNNIKQSEYGEYSDDVFTKLHSRVGGKGKSKIQNEELYKTWAQMDCQYIEMEHPCSRPKFFDDCTDIERDYNNDINITLNELIEKVSDYPCMVETRKKAYQWSKDSGNLYGLCKGQYDHFCNKDFAKEKGSDKCLAKLNKKKKQK